MDATNLKEQYAIWNTGESVSGYGGCNTCGDDDDECDDDDW